MRKIQHYLSALLFLFIGYTACKLVEKCLRPKITFPQGSSSKALILQEEGFLNGKEETEFFYTTLSGYYKKLDISRGESLGYDILAANKYHYGMGYPNAYDIISEIQIMTPTNDRNTIFLLHEIALDFLISGSKVGKGGCAGILHGLYDDGEDFYNPYIDSVVVNYK